MKTFIELKRVNRYGEEKDVLINTSKVVGVTEIHVEDTNLYDENGDLVKTETAPKMFRVFVEGTTAEIKLNEENYELLKKELDK